MSNGNAIVIDDTVGSGAIIALTLEDDTTITGGTLRVGEGSELAVENSKGAVLDGVTVTNDGNIEIDPAKATLIADDGTTITGGVIDDAATARAQSEAITTKLFGDRRPPAINMPLPVWQRDA